MKLYQNLNVTGSLTLSGSLTTSGSLSILGSISGSLTLTGSNNVLKVNGSGSSIISANGTSGKLFSIDDDLTNNLFSVTNISGLPVMQAFADGTVNLGTFNSTITGSSINITPNGYVGFNTANPTEKVDINIGIGSGRNGVAITGEYPFIKFNVTSSQVNARNWCFSSPVSEWGDFALLQGTAKDVNPISSGNAAIYFSKNGNVQIGYSAGDFGSKLYVLGGNGQGAGWIQQDSAPPLYLNRTGNDGGEVIFLKAGVQVGTINTNSYSLPSDLNFKKNIEDLELGLNLVSKLRSVSYNHKIDDEDAALSTGFIAQELEQSLSELGVEQNKYHILQHIPNEKEGESQYWLDYQKMIPVLVKAIQDQQQQIDELKNK